jgi:hypothetical protein
MNTKCPASIILNLFFNFLIFLLFISPLSRFLLTTQTQSFLKSIIICDYSIQSGTSLPVLWRNELPRTSRLKGNTSRQVAQLTACLAYSWSLKKGAPHPLNAGNLYQPTGCHIFWGSPTHNYHDENIQNLTLPFNRECDRDSKANRTRLCTSWWHKLAPWDSWWKATWATIQNRHKQKWSSL